MCFSGLGLLHTLFNTAYSWKFTDTALPVLTVKSESESGKCSAWPPLVHSPPEPVSSPVPFFKQLTSPYDWLRGGVGVDSDWLHCFVGTPIGPAGSGRIPSATANCYKRETEKFKNKNKKTLKTSHNLRLYFPWILLTLCRSNMCFSPSDFFWVRESRRSSTDCLGCMPVS